MARRPEEYLDDILISVEAVRAYTKAGRGAFLRSAMAQDAVVARIIRIGEAVKGAQAAGLALDKMAAEIPWGLIAGMRDLLSHQYWRIDPAILWGVVAKDLGPLATAVRKLRAPRRKR